MLEGDDVDTTVWGKVSTEDVIEGPAPLPEGPVGTEEQQTLRNPPHDPATNGAFSRI